MKKKAIRKIRLGKWKAYSQQKDIWYVYYEYSPVATIVLKGNKRVELPKNLSIRKLYYFARFVNKVVDKTS